MCGIAGYLGTRTLEPETVEAALASIRHRGPDHAGSASFRTQDGRNAYLLATRLDIIDVRERSNQPFTVGTKTMVYNGELYNYLEVRAGLRSRGRTFATESDTEVLLTAFDEHGVDALDACEGMWAFAVWDDEQHALTLSRDRFGEKPLYLHRADDGLYFASEPKAIFALLGRKLPPNLAHLYRYLVTGYKSLYKQRETFFVGLDELEPGTSLTLDADGEHTQRYWHAVPVHADETMSREQAMARTRELLIRSVELRLRADVPLAFAMSGGVDSLSLISVAKRELGYDVHGFTIVNRDARYDERELVDLAVEELGVRHTAIPTTTDGALEKLRSIVRGHDAPVATISFFVHWLLMQAVGAEGYRVCVSGIAGDELFTGYYDHHLAYLHEIRHDPELHATALAAWQEHVAPHVRNPYLQNPSLFDDDPHERRHIYLGAETFAAAIPGYTAEPFVEERHSNDLLRNRMLNELFAESVPVMLHEDDANAMYFSIENRSPFLDRALYEHAFRIPTRHLIRDAHGKSVLRDAMRGIVPDAVLDSRRKVGFNAPIHDLLDDDTRAYLRDRSSLLYEHLSPEIVDELLAKDFLPNSESKFLFNVLNAKLFLEENA